MKRPKKPKQPHSPTDVTAGQSSAPTPVFKIPKELEELDLPEEVKVSVIQSMAFQGPLPPPEMFKHYDEVVPGSAERILQLAEREQEHRHSWEKDAMRGDLYQIRFGGPAGLIVALACLGGAVILGMNGHPLLAGLMCSAPVLGTMYQLVYGKKQKPDAK